MNALLHRVHIVGIVVERIAAKVSLVIERRALVTPNFGGVEHHLIVGPAIR